MTRLPILFVAVVCCAVVSFAITTPQRLANASPTKSKAYENPQPRRGSDEILIDHFGYRLSFNPTTLCPNWVAWELTKEETNAIVPRRDQVDGDPKWPNRLRLKSNAYKGSGWSRGHMCPAADMRWDERAQTACFYMSNMCPQDQSLNSGSWAKLEQACRRWAQREGNIYIVCGPVFKPSGRPATINSGRKIRIPDGFFKAVLCLKPGREKAIGFYYDNNAVKQNMQHAAMSVVALEQMTGFDFFYQLPDDVEQRLESSYNFKLWQ